MGKPNRVWNKLSIKNSLFILIFIIFVGIPQVWSPTEYPFFINIIVWSLFYAYLASAWNILAGYTGQFSFGHTAFVGLGAYTTGLLYTNWSISPWIGMWVGVALSLAASLAIGLPSLRLRGHYFILITIAFAEILRYTALTWESLTGGGAGFSYEPTSWNNFTAFQFNIDKTPYYYIIFAMLLLNLYLVYKLKDSKWGYYFVAIREDEELATASGINVTKYKLLATALSAALTSIGGSFYMQFVLYIDPQMVLSLELMTKMMLPAALGGMGTVIGPVIGSFILIPLGEYIRVYFSQIQALHLIVYGLILGIVSISMPGGIIGRLSKTGISSRLSSRRLKKI